MSAEALSSADLQPFQSMYDSADGRSWILPQQRRRTCSHVADQQEHKKDSDHPSLRTTPFGVQLHSVFVVVSPAHTHSLATSRMAAAKKCGRAWLLEFGWHRGYWQDSGTAKLSLIPSDNNLKACYLHCRAFLKLLIALYVASWTQRLAASEHLSMGLLNAVIATKYASWLKIAHPAKAHGILDQNAVITASHLKRNAAKYQVCSQRASMLTLCKQCCLLYIAAKREVQ